ncbi:hypothetical protein D3C86_2019240 [compost metagenome]
MLCRPATKFLGDGIGSFAVFGVSNFDFALQHVKNAVQRVVDGLDIAVVKIVGGIQR